MQSAELLGLCLEGFTDSRRGCSTAQPWWIALFSDSFSVSYRYLHFHCAVFHFVCMYVIFYVAYFSICVQVSCCLPYCLLPTILVTVQDICEWSDYIWGEGCCNLHYKPNMKTFNMRIALNPRIAHSGSIFSSFQIKATQHMQDQQLTLF